MVVDQAYATCLRLARQHYENFPVASRFLPRATRHHVAAIYAFARIADDFADEGDRPDAERLDLLEDWRRRLSESLGDAGHERRGSSEADQVFVALANTIRSCRLEPALFEDLLSAFMQDVRVKRYTSWPELLEYCRRSANPIGRLVLRVHGYRDETMDRASDAICTALQLTNFWQDLGRDWAKGRVYVPRDVLMKSGADETDLARGQLGAPWQSVLRDLVDRTRQLFEQGRPLPDRVSGRLRWELRATWLGGGRILDRVEALGPEVFRSRPSLGWADAPGLIWRTLCWSRQA